MAKGDWWFKFEIPAWRNAPELRQCSLHTRGFWIECIAVMRETGIAKLSGSIEDFARMAACFPADVEKAIAELRRTKTADVTQKADVFTLVSRKFKRELKVREQNRLRKQKERCHADVTDVSRDQVKSKEKEVSKEKRGETALDAPSPPKRGTRIPEPFLLTPEMKTWAKEKRPLTDLTEETEKFVNYFRAKTGKDATKLDWLATWKNWILNARTNGAAPKPMSKFYH